MAHHHPVVSFGADDSSHALCSLPHCVKGEEIALLDLEGFPQILQASPESGKKALGGETGGLLPQLTTQLSELWRIAFSRKVAVAPALFDFSLVKNARASSNSP